MSQVKKEEIHQAILASAFECFTARGYTGTTIPMIARGAGISPPNVYSYFPSKLHVLYAIYEPWMRARFAELEQDLRARRTPARRLRRIFEVLWRELPAFEQGFANNVIQAISTATPEDEYRTGLIDWMESEIERMILAQLPPERHALVSGSDVPHMVVMTMDGYIMYRHTAPHRVCNDATIDAFCRMLLGDPAGR
jgi:AcrR family transcriptional regulator